MSLVMLTLEKTCINKVFVAMHGVTSVDVLC